MEKIDIIFQRGKEEAKKVKLKRNKEINHISNVIETQLNTVMDMYEANGEIEPPNSCEISIVYGSDYTDMDCVNTAVNIIREFGFTITKPKIIETASIDQFVRIIIKW